MAKICVITQDMRLGGGIRTMLLAFLRFAASRGHRCDLYYPEEGACPPEEIERMRDTGAVEQIVAVPIFGKAPHFVRAAAFARRCPLHSAYDAYQLVGPWLSLGLPFERAGQRFIAWLAGSSRAEIEGMPKTKLRHGLLYNPVTLALLARQERKSGRLAAVVLACSRYSADNLERDAGIPRERSAVLPVPVDLERFCPGEPVRTGRPYVVSVSRLMRGKGYPALLEAFAEVARRVDGVDLQIVGDGPERRNLERLARSLGLDRRVVFRGELRDESLFEAYRGATLFALASDQEGLPIVLLEAMACGLPVVCTACGGPTDHLVSGETGFLVPVGARQELVERIVEILKDPETGRSLGRAARRHAMDTFSFEVIGRRLDRVYKDVFAIRPVSMAGRS